MVGASELPNGLAVTLWGRVGWWLLCVGLAVGAVEFAPDALDGLLSDVIRILRGPTIVEIDRAGDAMVRTTLRTGPDPASPWVEDTGTDRLLARLLLHVRGVPVHRDVCSYEYRH